MFVPINVSNSVPLNCHLVSLLHAVVLTALIRPRLSAAHILQRNLKALPIDSFK